MHTLRDLSIDKKLTLIIMSTSSITLLSAAVGFVAYDLSSLREVATAELSALAAITGANASAAVEFEVPASATDILASLASERQIVVACIYSPDGALFAQYNRGEETCPKASPSVEASAPDHMSVLLPVRSGTQQVGMIYLEADLQKLRSRLARYAQIVAAVVLVSILVAFGVSSRLQSMVSEPISSLVRTARIVSEEHDFSVRAEGAGRDEVGKLFVAFNDMLAEIEERDGRLLERTREIERANRDLEHEVVERKRAEDKIRALADHDALTGLPNRRLFKDRVRMALGQARRRHTHPSVLFLDLDRFKVVNDSLGHDVGDLLLQKVGERLVASVRESDTVARLGGDEFTILLPDAGDATDVARTAEKILESIRQPIDIESRELHVTPSIGVAVFPEDGRDVDTLIKNADTAMYRAKDAGRDNYQLYTSAMKAQALGRLGLEGQLRRALGNGELEMHYQPVVAIGTGEIHGAEALLRWRHPQRGFISTSEFVPLAEATGLILPIGEWALRESCARARQWRRKSGGSDLSLAVNLSARQLHSADVTAQVRAALDHSGFEPQRLELEVTESRAIESFDTAIRTLEQLRELGVRISLDDFGVGYSSLNHLRRLPIDTLKIDRSFVRDIDTDPQDNAIVAAVVDMAHGLGLTVVAEGVETATQLACLRAHGCDRMQGNYFSAALPEPECREVVQSGARLGDVIPVRSAEGGEA